MADAKYAILVAAIVHVIAFPAITNSQSPPSPEKFKPLIQDFSVRLFKDISKSAGTNNILLSPLAASAAILMYCNAANGSTLQEIHDAFKLDKSVKCFEVFETLFKMTASSAHQEKSPQDDIHISIGRGYVDKSIRLNPALVAAANANSNPALPGVVDFGHPDAARNEINQWMSNKTLGKINEFLADGAISSSSRFLILSGNYLQFFWSLSGAFESKLTTKGDFANGDGSHSQVEYMTKNGTTTYKYKHFDADAATKTPAFHALKLPSRWGTFSVSILMPDRVRDLSALEQSVSNDFINKAVTGNSKEALLNLAVPKFKLEQTADLAASMKNLGVSQFFSKNADLSGLSMDATFGADAVRHSVLISIDEIGFTAKTSTAGLSPKISRGSVGFAQPVNLRIDHAFLLVVQMESTGYLTHIARVNKIAN